MDSDNGTHRSGSQRYGCIALDYEDIKHLYRTLNLESSVSPGIAFEAVADRYLEILDRHQVSATLFVVGEDCESPRSRAGLQRFVRAGHEIANHTMTHPFGMRRLSRKEKVREIVDAQNILQDTTGTEVVGYKAPAHDIDGEVIDILEELGFLYDASVYPSFFNPVLNVCYRIAGGGRPVGLGDWQCSFAPNRPYRIGKPFWRSGTRKLVEFPISQIPVVRFPFYATVMFIAGMKSFKLALSGMGRMSFLTYVFHSFDLIGENDEGFDPALKGYPALRRPLTERLTMVDEAIGALAARFRLVTYRQAVTDPEIRNVIV